MLFSADSVSGPHTTRYYTRMGRVVYGGGGITPDIFVPRDSTGLNAYYVRLMRSGTLMRFAFSYADTHRTELLAYKTASALDKHLQSIGDQLVSSYAVYAQRYGVPQRPGMLLECAPLLRRDLIALIADLIGGDRNLFYELRNERDPEVIKALEILESPDWKPKKS